MVPQTWMVPEQNKYDVIHYIRETYLKPYNSTQYAKIDARIADFMEAIVSVENAFNPQTSIHSTGRSCSEACCSIHSSAAHKYFCLVADSAMSYATANCFSAWRKPDGSSINGD